MHCIVEIAGLIFNKSSTSTWEQIVSLSLLIYSFIPMLFLWGSVYVKEKKYRVFKLTLKYIGDVLSRLTRRVPLVEQKLLTLPEHLSSSLIFSGVRVTRSLNVYVCFVDRCLSFCTFSFGHCVVCSSLIYGFWLPLWYFQALLMSKTKQYEAFKLTLRYIGDALSINVQTFAIPIPLTHM